MSKEKQKTYSAPTIEVLNARIERGFEGSVTPFPNPTNSNNPNKAKTSSGANPIK